MRKKRKIDTIHGKYIAIKMVRVYNNLSHKKTNLCKMTNFSEGRKRMKEQKEMLLRKLRRADLLEMLIEQGKEVEALRTQVEELQKKLDEKTIRLEQAGNIAEAALKLNGVFEAAQAAAQQYLESVQEMSGSQNRDAGQNRNGGQNIDHMEKAET